MVTERVDVNCTHLNSPRSPSYQKKGTTQSNLTNSTTIQSEEKPLPSHRTLHTPPITDLISSHQAADIISPRAQQRLQIN